MSGRGAEIPLLACRSLYPSFVVAPAGFRFLLPFAVTRSPTFLLSDLLHPLQLAQFIQFIIERDPRTGHFRVDLAESTFADASAGAMAHEFWALGLERAIRNWWSLVHPSRMLLAMFFSRDQYSYRHRRSVDRNALSNNVYPLLG